VTQAAGFSRVTVGSVTKLPKLDSVPNCAVILLRTLCVGRGLRKQFEVHSQLLEKEGRAGLGQRPSPASNLRHQRSCLGDGILALPL
jgi:hypothetical protein